MGHEKTKLGRVRAMLSLGSFSYCWLVANLRKAKTVSTSVSGPWRHTECTRPFECEMPQRERKRSGS